MATLAPAIMALEHILGGMHAAGQREVSMDLAVQDGDPAQRQTQLGGGAQIKAVDDFQLFQVEVGLVEAVEEHQPIGAGF